MEVVLKQEDAMEMMEETEAAWQKTVCEEDMEKGRTGKYGKSYGKYSTYRPDRE